MRVRGLLAVVIETVALVLKMRNRLAEPTRSLDTERSGAAAVVIGAEDSAPGVVDGDIGRSGAHRRNRVDEGKLPRLAGNGKGANASAFGAAKGRDLIAR